jgi:hypothetical protein
MEGLPKNVGLFAFIVKQKVIFFSEGSIRTLLFQKIGREGLAWGV